MLLFALDDDDRPFAQALAADLDCALAPHELRRFDDGEAKCRPLVDPRGEDAYVLQSLHGGPQESPHDKLVRLLLFIATLRDHGALRVSAVIPYFAYARKDRRTQPHDPVGQRGIAQLIEAMGASQVITIEPHNPAAFDNAFRIPTLPLQGLEALRNAVAGMLGDGPVAVASPDLGGAKRAQLWREDLEAHLKRTVGFAVIDKRRSAGVLGGGSIVAGDVSGATVVLVDDMVATGETLQRAARALRAAGARHVVACATHGLFVGAAGRTLADGSVERLVVTDTVPPFRLPPGHEVPLVVASAVPLVASALRESHASFVR